MNIDDVQQWCQAKGVDAKMIVRGAEFPIRHDAFHYCASAPEKMRTTGNALRRK